MRLHPLSKTDVRAVVRLLGEAAERRGGHAAQKLHLMHGLSTLIGADSWAWGLYCSFAPDAPPTATSIVHHGFTPEQYASFIRAIEHRDTGALNAPLTHEFARQPRHLTRTRQQMVADDVYEKTEVHALWRAADVGAVILSVRPVDERSQSVLGIYRRYGRPLFSATESRLAHIVLSEVGWLHEAGWPEDRGVTVPHARPPGANDAQPPTRRLETRANRGPPRDLADTPCRAT